MTFDVSAAVMSAFSLGVLITAIDGVGHGENTALVILQAVGALAIGALLVTRELSRASPLLPVDLMRIPLFALSVLTSICALPPRNRWRWSRFAVPVREHAGARPGADLDC